MGLIAFMPTPILVIGDFHAATSGYIKMYAITAADSLPPSCLIYNPNKWGVSIVRV
jgi:hypothetical protein